MIPAFLCLFLFLLSAPAQADEALAPFHHSEWEQFLKKYVNEKGEVNYRAAKREPALLNAYFEKLKGIPKDTLQGWSREEKIATFINAYNASVVQMILAHYPLKTITEIPGVWDLATLQVSTDNILKGWTAGGKYSLNQIQKDVLLGLFRDEKILFALSSGTKGSPRLRQEAYQGPKLEGQLYLAAREFVNDASKNQIEAGQKKIILSRLFKWHAEDLLMNWGNFPEEKAHWKPEEMAVLNFLAHSLDDPKKAEFLQEGKYKVTYSAFDWALNEWRSDKTS